MLPQSGNRYGDLLKELYDGIKNDNLPSSRVDDIQRIFNDLSMRDDKYKAWLRQQDNRIGADFLDLPFAPIYSNIFEEDIASIVVPIPGGYKHLIIIGNGRTTKADYYEDIALRFNEDSGANYSRQNVFGFNTTNAATQFTGQTSIFIGTFVAASAAANSRGSFFSVLTNVQSAAWKPVQTLRSSRYISATAMYAAYTGSYWESTSPVTSVTLFPADGNSFLATTSISIYGLV